MSKVVWDKIEQFAKDAGYILEKNENDTYNLFDVQCDCYMYRDISANVVMMVIQSTLDMIENMN
jgi:hypothetical protein